MYIWRRYRKKDSKKMTEFLSKLGVDTIKFFDRFEGSNPITELSKEEYRKIVGVLNGEIIAFGYLWENDNYPDIPSLGIVIRDDWQGKGVGQHLMLKLIDLGIKLKTKGIYISVHDNNKSAIHIYRKLGWKVIGKRKDSPKLEMIRET